MGLTEKKTKTFTIPLDEFQEKFSIPGTISNVSYWKHYETEGKLLNPQVEIEVEF